MRSPLMIMLTKRDHDIAVVVGNLDAAIHIIALYRGNPLMAFELRDKAVPIALERFLDYRNALTRIDDVLSYCDEPKRSFYDYLNRNAQRLECLITALHNIADKKELSPEVSDASWDFLVDAYGYFKGRIEEYSRRR